MQSAWRPDHSAKVRRAVHGPIRRCTVRWRPNPTPKGSMRMSLDRRAVAGAVALSLTLALCAMWRGHRRARPRPRRVAADRSARPGGGARARRDAPGHRRRARLRQDQRDRSGRRLARSCRWTRARSSGSRRRRARRWPTSRSRRRARPTRRRAASCSRSASRAPTPRTWSRRRSARRRPSELATLGGKSVYRVGRQRAQHRRLPQGRHPVQVVGAPSDLTEAIVDRAAVGLSTGGVAKGRLTDRWNAPSAVLISR